MHATCRTEGKKRPNFFVSKHLSRKLLLGNLEFQLTKLWKWNYAKSWVGITIWCLWRSHTVNHSDPELLHIWHGIFPTQGRQYTPFCIKGILEQGRANGFKFTSDCLTLVFFFFSSFSTHSWVLRPPQGVCVKPFRATSHTSQGLWPRSCESPWFSSKGHISDMVCHSLRHACLLEVDMMQCPTYHETLFIGCHVAIHAEFASMIISLGLWVFPF